MTWAHSCSTGKLRDQAEDKMFAFPPPLFSQTTPFLAVVPHLYFVFVNEPCYRWEQQAGQGENRDRTECGLRPRAAAMSRRCGAAQRGSLGREGAAVSAAAENSSYSYSVTYCGYTWLRSVAWWLFGLLDSDSFLANLQQVELRCNVAARCGQEALASLQPGNIQPSAAVAALCA